VRVPGRAQAQCPLQLDLPARALQQVRATDHVGNVLIRIIDHHRELIGDQPVPTPDHHIPECGKALTLQALDAIVEFDPLTVTDPEAGGGRGCGAGA